MTTGTRWNIERLENLVLKAYLVVGAFVCGLTCLMAARGTPPAGVDEGLSAVWVNALCLGLFIVAWHLWSGGRGVIRAPFLYLATILGYSAAGMLVGSPSGDTRAVFVLNLLLLFAFLLRGSKAPVKAS